MLASALDRLKTMGEYEPHSLILACDFRVEDVDRMSNWLAMQHSGLASVGAHHVVVYTSIWEPGRVLATIGIRNPRSVRDVLRSPAIFEWFNISGADDIPPIFGGEVVEKIDLTTVSPAAPFSGVIVGVIATVDDVAALMVKVHDGLNRFRRAGVRKVWVYRALDDGHEVMILQEMDSEIAAREWIDHPDGSAVWMSRAGFGAYPSLFVGKLASLMTLDEQG